MFEMSLQTIFEMCHFQQIPTINSTFWRTIIIIIDQQSDSSNNLKPKW